VFLPGVVAFPFDLTLPGASDSPMSVAKSQICP
jgi:hypothetical protein